MRSLRRKRRTVSSPREEEERRRWEGPRVCWTSTSHSFSWPVLSCVPTTYSSGTVSTLAGSRKSSRHSGRVCRAIYYNFIDFSVTYNLYKRANDHILP